MIKFRKLPENILQFLPGAFEYLESHPTVIFSYLFGSLSKGKPSPLSDVDIAVFLKKAENAPFTASCHMHPSCAPFHPAPSTAMFCPVPFFIFLTPDT